MHLNDKFDIKTKQTLPFLSVHLGSIFDLPEDMINLAGEHILFQAFQEVNHVVKDRAFHRSQLSKL